MLGDFKVNVLFTTAVSLLIWAFMVVEKTLYGIMNLHYDVVFGSERMWNKCIVGNPAGIRRL